MGDRSFGWIRIGGMLKRHHIRKLAVAIELDAGKPDVGTPALTADEASALIEAASGAGQPLRLIAEDANGGELDVVETACRILGLSYAAGWDPGDEYPEGAKFFSPADSCSYGTSGGYAAFTVDELRHLLDGRQPFEQGLVRLAVIHDQLQGAGLILKVLDDDDA